MNLQNNNFSPYSISVGAFITSKFNLATRLLDIKLISLIAHRITLLRILLLFNLSYIVVPTRYGHVSHGIPSSTTSFLTTFSSPTTLTYSPLSN